MRASGSGPGSPAFFSSVRALLIAQESLSPVDDAGGVMKFFFVHVIGRCRFGRSRLRETSCMADQLITRDCEVLNRTPVFRGTRVPFQTLLDYIEGGETLDEFLDDFPTVTREMAVAALEHAKSLLLAQV